MIKVENVENLGEFDYISLEDYKEHMNTSLMIQMTSDYKSDRFYTTCEGSYLKYVVKAVNKKRYYSTVMDLIDSEKVFENFDELTIEDGIEEMYKNKLIDLYDLCMLVRLSELVDEFIKDKVEFVFPVSIDSDTLEGFYVDNSAVDFTEVSKPVAQKGIGDSVSFKDGRTGIIEDTTDTHYLVRDNFGKECKVRKKSETSRAKRA